MSRLVQVAAGVALLLSAAVSAHAQKLGVQGDRFTIDGAPRFLTFMSMFGAMGAPNINADLHTLKTLGFDGFRVWPNLYAGLFNSNGSVKPDGLARLRVVLDQARVERLVVDVTFTYEHTAGLTPAGARNAILAVTDALRSYDNILFDIQNERNVGDRRFMSEGDVASILGGIRSVDPARIVVCSNSPVDPPEYAAAFTGRLGLDATAYHEPRSTSWYSLSSNVGVVAAMRANGKPAYLQEPMTTRDDLFAYPSHDRAEYFMQAIANAKRAGAAAWCFHTDAGLDYNDGGPPLLEDRLRGATEPEWLFVTSLLPRVIFRTANGSNFLVAEGGGGAGVRADRTSAGPGGWEVFTVTAQVGGPLLADDRVTIATANGMYAQALNGGGATMRAAGTTVGIWETFRILKAAGGAIRHGDQVSLRANDSPFFVSAENGGGGNVTANAAAIGPSETFTILFLSPHPTDPAP